LEKLNIMIDKYIELSVIEKVNDEAYLLELMNNIKNEIDGLMPDELKVVYHEYLKKILELKSKIVKHETTISNYYQNKEKNSILLSSCFISLLEEINKLKSIKIIYQEILLYIKEIKRKRRSDSILRLTKKSWFRLK